MNPLENLRIKKHRPNHKFSLIRNWTTHNIVGHPLSEILWWVLRPFSREKAKAVSNWIHDITVPEDKEE